MSHTHHYGAPAADPQALPRRDLGLALRRGFAGRCPHCGQGKLFRAFLKVTDRCAACGAEFHAHRADDLPAYITISIVGHVVVGGMLYAETYGDWPILWHVILWPLLTIVLSLAIIQPIKGAIVGLQWANRMHGFSATPDGDDLPVLQPHRDAAR
ncbi:DUF983 domain-containing protein [Alsobacter sp. KACC 23698]|uniref:DUF983 domain-containing protein n=1 Tax=Alsobacter sp. KACC 23698 TaxID=3149229 RepID=A0AAU7JA08_9HYPH